MLLSEIVNTLFVQSGQYITGGLSAMNLNMGAIWAAFEPEVHRFEKFDPVKKHFNIQTGDFFRYDFTQNEHNVGYSTDTATTITQTVDLAVEDTQTFTIQLPNTDIFPTSVTVSFGDTQVAVDASDGSGNLAFSDGYETNYSGVVNYLTGLVTFTAINITEITDLSVTVSATYVINGEPPVTIVSFMPVGTMTVISMLAYFMSPMVRRIYSPDRLVEPRMFLYKYVRPVLYLTEVGPCDCVATYNYERKPIYDSNNNLLDLDLVDIEHSSNYYVLLQILLGRFMQVIGRARRAFTFNDLGLTSDAVQLTEDGDRIYADACKLLTENSDWFLSVRP